MNGTTLEIAQAEMRERWRDKNTELSVENVTEAELALANYKARTDLVCPYCRVNTTRESQRTRQLLPCTKCKNRRISLFKYGLTLRQFFTMLREQDGKCAICDQIMVTPCVDHCHDMDHCRGLLCHSCNVGIGFMKDDEEIMNRAIKYLSCNRLARKWYFQI